MYSVYSVIDGEEICIYDDLSDAESLRLIDPQLELERNSAGKFTFTLPPTNIAYGTYIQKTYVITGYRPVDSSNSQQNSSNQNEDDGQPDLPIEPIVEEKEREVDLMERMVSKIIIYRDEFDVTYGDRSRTKKKFWEGRVISESKDWFNCRAVECEGALAYLNDTVQNPKMFGTASGGSYVSNTPNEIMRYIMTVHNQKVDASKRLTYVNGTITDHRTGENLEPFEIAYMSTMEAVKSLIDTYGGIIQVYYTSVGHGDSMTWQANIRWDDKDNVVDVTTPQNLSVQTIDFGKNLLDFKCKWDLSKLCTVAIPTGAKIENTGTDEIGDQIPIHQITPTEGQYLYVGDGSYGDTGIVYVVKDRSTTGYELKSYKTAVYNIPNDYADNVVYITCRVTDGVAAYCTCSKENWYCAGDNNEKPWGTYQIGYAIAKPTTGSTFQDFVDYKIELPHGTKSIALCSFGNDLQMACKKRKLQTTTTVTETERPLASGTSTTSNKLVLATHTEEDHQQQLYPPHVVTSSDNNYNYRVIDVTELPRGTKVYISARAEVGTVLYVASKSTSLSSVDNQVSYMAASSSNNRFKEIDAYEYTIEAGVNYIHVVSYEGQGTDWPKVTYNRTETTTKNDYIPAEKYVTIEEAENADITDTATSTIYRWHEKGSPYVINKALVEKYGWIERMLSFESITDPNLLCRSAVEYVKNSAFDEMSIDLTAIDMRALGAMNVEYFTIENVVHATSIMHGLDKMFPITKLSIPLNKPDNMKVTIGETQSDTMTDSSNRVNQDILNNISFSTKNALTEAKDHAAALIGTGGNGFVSLIKDETNDYIKEIVISDQPDPHNASHMWILNQNGIGHFNGSYPIDPNDHINVAMTMDGSIVADFITSGVLRSIGISGCKGVFKNDGTSLLNGTGIVFADTRIDDPSIYPPPGSGPGRGSVTNKVKALEMRNGRINFYNCDDVLLNSDTGNYSIVDNVSGGGTTPVDTPFAYISTTTEESGSGRGFLSITGPILAFNADSIWVSSTVAGTDGEGGATVNNVSVIDNSETFDGNGQTFYLPTTNNPTSSSDYQAVYIRNGVITSSSNGAPTHSIKFKHGFAID